MLGLLCIVSFISEENQILMEMHKDNLYPLSITIINFVEIGTLFHIISK